MMFAHRLQALDRRYAQWKADHLVFGNFHRRVQKNRVNLYYWTHAAGDNVGDLISLVLVRKIVKSLGLDFDQHVRQTRKLFAVGSILEQVVEHATVWGSGLRHPVVSPANVTLDVRAVRGPLTREALLHVGVPCPEVFGDPAILLPRFYRPKPVRRRPFLVIPHFLREKELLQSHPGACISTLTSNWQGFVDAIAGADLVISGSLHGIVLAEAYGVPAVLLASAADRDRFKYDDYYQGTGRSTYAQASTVDEALALGGQPVPALGACRDRLLEAFPQDLWES